jgi:uncharacterized protein YsxB (DUF464 family)
MKRIRVSLAIMLVATMLIGVYTTAFASGSVGGIVVGKEYSATFDDGYMYLRVPSENAYLCEILLKGLKNHLILMEESYPRNIKVNYEEVK